MLISPVVDFDPITAEMGPGTTWHPYHALSALRNVPCLGGWLEIEIQLSRLTRLVLRVHDLRFNRVILNQCDPVNARLQSLRNIAALWIGLNCAEDLFAVPRFDPKVCAFNRFAFCIFDKPLKGRWPVRCNFVRWQAGFRYAITHIGSDSRPLRRRGRLRCNFVRWPAGFRYAITHTGVECRLWTRSDHVRRNFVRSQTGFRCAITHTGIEFPRWSGSGHWSVRAARLELARRC